MIRPLGFGIFAALCAWICYRDWKFQKIPNYLLGLGVLLILLLGLSDGRAGWWKELGFQAVVSFGIAFGFWQLNIWPSGDAKLFTLLSAFLVLTVSSGPPSLPVGLCFIHLVNIFIPAGLTYVLHSIMLLLRKYKDASVVERIVSILKFYKAKVLPSWKKDGQWVCSVQRGLHILFLQGFALFCYRWILPLSGEAPLLFAVVGQRLLSQWVPSPKDQSPTSFAGTILATGLIYATVFYHSGGLTAAIFCVFRLVLVNAAVKLFFTSLDYCMDEVDVVEIPVEQLRPNVLLADSTKRALMNDELGAGRAVGKLYPDGLTQEQMHIVKQWCLARRFPTIAVCRAYSFAFWIALGTLWTVATRQDFVSWLRQCFSI